MSHLRVPLIMFTYGNSEDIHVSKRLFSLTQVGELRCWTESVAALDQHISREE